MHCSPPDSSVHRILQARILEWVAISSSRGSSLTQGSNPHLLCWQMDSLPLATTWEVQDRSKQWKGSEDDVGEEMKSLRASKRNQDLSPRQAHFWLQLPRKGLKNGRTDSQKWKAQEKASPYGGFCSKGGIIESFHWKTSYSFEHVYCRAWVIQNLLYLKSRKQGEKAGRKETSYKACMTTFHECREKMRVTSWKRRKCYNFLSRSHRVAILNNTPGRKF